MRDVVLIVSVALEDVLDVTKRVLLKMKAEKTEPVPLFIIDDIHYAVHTETQCLERDATLFVEWLLEMKSSQLINLIFIAREADYVRDILFGSMSLAVQVLMM